MDFIKASAQGYIPGVKGFRRKTLAYGDKELLCEFRMEGNIILPEHSHPEEQIGYLVSGHIVLYWGGAAHDVTPGDSWCIPGGVPHSTDVLEDSVSVEVFSPVRKDYLP